MSVVSVVAGGRGRRGRIRLGRGQARLSASKRDSAGRWLLDVAYPGEVPAEMEEGEERPSRWNMLRAWRVLNWYSAQD